jgi:hypothetical protein
VDLQVALKRKCQCLLHVIDGGSVHGNGGDAALATRIGAVPEDGALRERCELPVVRLLRPRLVRAPDGVAAVGLDRAAKCSVEVGVVAVVARGVDVKDRVREGLREGGPVFRARPAGLAGSAFAGS